MMKEMIYQVMKNLKYILISVKEENMKRLHIVCFQLYDILGLLHCRWIFYC